MPASEKYGQVRTERGDFPDDNEPVWLFRAKDGLLPAVLDYYMTLCEEAGSPHEHIEGIRKARDDVRKWQSQNRTQVPGTSPR
jgi:hypothetical protein